MTRGRILVVEDDPALRDTLAEVLRDGGHDVRVAGDGEAALATIDTWEPQLIVLDLMMPRMDGFAFVQAQRNRAHGVEAAAVELRADAWLVKPFGLDDVLASVDRLLPKG